MSRSATHTRFSNPPYRPAHRAAQARPAKQSALGAWTQGMLRLFVACVLLAAVALLGPGLVLDTPQPPPQPSDAIVVISGDEQMARFQEGLNLYQRGLGQYLVFSGA